MFWGDVKLKLEHKVLVIILVFFACLSTYRGVHFYITGFFVPDEFGYFYDAVTGTTYSYRRALFEEMNMYLFRLFSIESAAQFAVFLPFYLFLWCGLTIVIGYKIMKLLNFNEKVIITSLLTLPFLISFTIMSLGFLSESPSLTFVMFGIYILLKMKFYSPVLSSLSFAGALWIREPYLIFLIVSFPLILVFTVYYFIKHPLKYKKTFTRWSTTAVLGILMIFSFLIPVGIFTQYPLNISHETGVTIPQILPPPSIPPPTIELYQTQERVFMPEPTQQTKSEPSKPPVIRPAQDVYKEKAEVSKLVMGERNITKTVSLFSIGMLLGWGLLTPFLILGFISLTKDKRPKFTRFMVFFLTILSLGTFLGVCWLMSDNPLQTFPSNFSSLLRWSQTTAPAYFLLIPFAFFKFVYNYKRILIMLVVIMVATLSFLAPYQSYSTVGFTSSSNPFSLSYRTGGLEIVDYMKNHKDIPIMGREHVWMFAPRNLPKSQFYDYLEEEKFIEKRWDTFYLLFVSITAPKPPDYVVDMIYSSPQNRIYSIVNKTLVLKGIISHMPHLNMTNHFYLLKIDLEWT